MTDSFASNDPTDGDTNWLWLVDLPNRSRALVLDDLVSSTAPKLARIFEHVVSLSSDGSFNTSPLPDSGKGNFVGGSVLSLPFADGEFDCVCVSWDPSRRAAATLVRELFRVTRPRGLVYARLKASIPNGTGRSKTAPWTRVRVRWEFSRLCEKTGFKDLSTFYAIPSLEEPRALIPATRTGASVYQASQPLSRREALAHRIITAAGAHFLLYRESFVVAIR